jgi:hypothetical protein
MGQASFGRMESFIFLYNLVQGFPKKWWGESDFTAPNIPLPLQLKDSGCHYNSIFSNTETAYYLYFNSAWSLCVEVNICRFL